MHSAKVPRFKQKTSKLKINNNFAYRKRVI